jgi:hypothetical protein
MEAGRYGGREARMQEGRKLGSARARETGREVVRQQGRV